MELLQTKLAPPAIGRGVLFLPLALQALQEAAEYPVSLLIAPAGSGKTTLLAIWARQESSVAWFSMDAEDNDPARFWAYLLAAVQTVLPDLTPFSQAEMGDALLTGSLGVYLP